MNHSEKRLADGNVGKLSKPARSVHFYYWWCHRNRRCLVKAFAQQGAYVAFVDIDVDSANQLINELESEQGPKLWYQAVDVTNVQALQQAILEADAQLGPVCVLVNNAANDMRHAPADVTAQSWRDCMAINLDAAFFAAQAAAGLMTQRNSGSIINFSSINALLGPSTCLVM